MEQLKNVKSLQMMKALLISYGITGVLLLLLAFLLYKTGLGESQVNFGIKMIYIGSCFFGGIYMGRKAENRKFLWGIGIGVAYVFVLNAITWIAEHQLLKDEKEILGLLVLCMAGGMLGGMIS